MFYKIKDLLPKVINKLGIKKEAQASLVVGTAGGVILEIWGEKLASKITPKIFKDSTLYIETDNSTIASEINLSQNKLISKINQKIDQLLIKKITLRIKNR